ncbi:hypothetical protein LX32DRAFT_339720 [Colletotrichum zoysiae]|uniref:Uncharacterized protein n=1 Tax=Colletotrichum zoysiae TaxID=1216348 RepID=A0AAD9HTK9_9PEZI|nr:hypothetical protein LX32DRAFT_339720 [Colletotrichum zoysiae]
MFMPRMIDWFSGGEQLTITSNDIRIEVKGGRSLPAGDTDNQLNAWRGKSDARARHDLPKEKCGARRARARPFLSFNPGRHCSRQKPFHQTSTSVSCPFSRPQFTTFWLGTDSATRRGASLPTKNPH